LLDLFLTLKNVVLRTILHRYLFVSMLLLWK